MTWSRFDDRTRRHPKVVRAGNDAAAFWQWAIMYSNENGLDGYLPLEILPLIPPLPIHRLKARNLAERCADAVVKPGGFGLFERVDGGYRIHDIHDYQPSADKELQKREKRQEAGRLGGLKSGVIRRGKHEPPGQPNGEAIASPPAKHSGSNGKAETNPVPSRPVPSQIGTAEAAVPAAAASPVASPVASTALDAITAELRRYPLCAALPVPEVAAMLERRFRTLEISKGTKLEWALEAIGEAAADGVALNAQELTKKLRTYLDHARPPRSSGLRVVDNELDELDEDARAKREIDAEAQRLARASGPPPSPELLEELRAKLARTGKS